MRISDWSSDVCSSDLRRQALWQVRGLGQARLPLFAAADARESGNEPDVLLRPMAEGREVVEDYRTVQLSLRAHPLSFLRPERSEEHTSELQSLMSISYAVFCLKKNKYIITYTIKTKTE